MLSLPAPAAWMEQALCTQVDVGDIWFVEKGGSTREAKRVCAQCPVRTQCLEYALANNERFGVWGGLSERQRRQLGRERSGQTSLDGIPGRGNVLEHGLSRYKSTRHRCRCEVCRAANAEYQRRYQKSQRAVS